jgi:hypothetical protein
MPIAQVVLVRKPDVLKLAVEGEDGMIHSVLNALPPLDEGSETQKDVPSDQYTRSNLPDEIHQASSTAEAELLSQASDESARNESPIGHLQHIEQNPHSCLTENGASHDVTNGEVVRKESDVAADLGHSPDDHSFRRSDNLHPAVYTAQPRETMESPVTSFSEVHIDNDAGIAAHIDFVQPSRLQPLPPHTPSHSRPCTPPTLARASRSSSPTESRSSSFSELHAKSSLAPISLPSLLTHAAQLLEDYPPTLPQLRVKDILGPRSVVHTWRPPSRDGFSVQADNERDDEAEGWVGGPDVVLPFIEDEDIEESEAERKATSRKGPVAKYWRPFLLPRLRLRFGVLTPGEKRVLLIGAVVVVCLAVALRQNRGLGDVKKGWIAWACTFVGGIRSRIVP